MLGYDSVCYKSISFANRIRLAKKERRIYLTRSLKESKSKIDFSRRRIVSENVIEQLHELADFISYSENYLLTRCLDCNRELFPMDKMKIQHLIPPAIFQKHQDFKVCGKCGKIYWKGSHYQRMKETLKNTLTVS
jgi:uncharacterized protein with PIN domain